MCTKQASDAPILMLTMFFAEPHYHVRMWSATSLRGATLSWADVVSYESSRRSISGLAGRLAREIVVVGLQVPRRTLPLILW
jgi:hypothetical protein